MADYGVTKDGFVKKRYDVILSEMQDDIKEATDIDVSVNPQSYLNVILSSIADKLAGLYEVAEDVYYSHYPSTAEGINLDYACQLGGVTRQEASPTKVYMACTGDDGTILQTNVRISSNTTPKVYFTPCEVSQISHNNFNKAILTLSGDTGEAYTVTIDGIDCRYDASSGESAASILAGLAAKIEGNLKRFKATVSGDELTIASASEYDNHVLTWSSNLTGVDGGMTSIVMFQSEENGAYKFAAGVITNGNSNTYGISYTNLSACILGGERETDEELRLSYINKQAQRSSGMISSIVAAILSEVEGVTSCVGFENDTDGYDDDGRPPHSIEIVADGGDAVEIAQQIFNYKAAGIGTYGDEKNYEEVDVPIDNYSSVTVRFTRPIEIPVKIKIAITSNPKEAMPENAAALAVAAFLEFTEDIEYGTDVLLQQAVSYINAKVSGIRFMDISATYADGEVEKTDENGDPVTDEDGNPVMVPNVLTDQHYIIVDARHKATFAEGDIEVTIDGKGSDDEDDGG